MSYQQQPGLRRRTTRLAVASLVTSPPELRREMERIMLPLAGESGDGMALAGIILGWIVFVPWLGFWVRPPPSLRVVRAAEGSAARIAPWLADYARLKIWLGLPGWNVLWMTLLPAAVPARSQVRLPPWVMRPRLGRTGSTPTFLHFW
jgi:hypothetical protein